MGSSQLSGHHYVTHTTLAREQTAVCRMTRAQALIAVSLIGLLVVGLIRQWHPTLVWLVTLVTLLYGLDLLFNCFLVYRSFFRPVEIKITPEQLTAKRKWPRYTIFCPLYKEVAVLPQFILAISQLDYPKNRLEVLLLLEEDDTLTIEAVRAMTLPNYFQVLVVPDSRPKTKPKACNFGLAHATGEYAVIYDAEDIPERDQLKKAVLAFGQVKPQVYCLQAKLNYYNIHQNLLTRLFTLEYSLWFDLILTGLQATSAPIPLGGTSNHFRTANLRELEGWDPFNVTEDADLGMRIAKRGQATAILDSTTMEEANSQVKNWLKQRSRWIKGYMQTYLVHMRRPREMARTSVWHVVALQLVIGGKVASMLFNPFLWVLTIAYFALKPLVGGFIESLYIAPIYYLGLFSLVIGNFLYMYYYMMGAARRGQWDLMAYALLVPAYWVMMSLAAFYAMWELIVRPYHWNKTKHGLHLDQEKQRQEAEALVS